MSRRPPVRLVVAAFIVGCVSPSVFIWGQPLNGFDAYVREAVAAWEVPGLAVAVVKDGKTVFSRGYGIRRSQTRDPVDSHTRFAAASTTKAMTAAAIGMLVDEGKIKWDDRVQDVLPALQLNDPWVTRELTVRDLLTHRAGLGNADFLWYGQDTPVEEILRRIRFLRPAYSARSGFIYQNIMYGAAGELIRVVSGLPWEDFVRQRIFNPLEMADSVPTQAWLADEPNQASPHHRIDGKIEKIQTDQVASIAAAGAVWTSVEDLSRWIAFLLRNGLTRDGERLLTETTLEELFRPQVILEPDDFYPTAQLTKPHWITYGLGWFQHDYHGRKVDFHTGSIDGLVAIVGLIRESGVGVCVLANLDHAELRHALMYRVFDHFLGEPARDWSTELRELYAQRREKSDKEQEALEAARIAGTRPSLALQEYPGQYTDPLYGKLEVIDTGHGLRLQFGDKLAGKLEHWHYDTFRLLWDRAWMGKELVTFTLNSKGAVETLRFSSGFELQRVTN